MKTQKKRMRIIANLLVIVLAFGYTATAANAATARASDCISSYSGGATRSKSGITVSFNITATGRMGTLGAGKVVIEKWTSNGWTPVYTFYSSSTSGMTGSNTAFYGSSVTYSGINSSDTYRGKISFYAEDSTKSDSRLLTTNSV